MFQPATIILDVDGTLLQSPPCEGDYVAWEAQIFAEPCPPVPGAVEGVAALLVAYPRARVEILSARSPFLGIETRRDLLDHFGPSCGNCHHSLCKGGDSKRRELAGLLAYGPALIVDDDASLVDWIRPVDRLLHAPACWRQIVPLLDALQHGPRLVAA